ncbi:hypothetical protein AMECASPLE_024330 [Ameca splendens]|uniref:Secreted protein n=1 Tax=Ameca splendens TaxID=208324 RepID=A0ABV0YR95_9TELE
MPCLSRLPVCCFVPASCSAGDLRGRGLFVGTRGFYSNNDVTEVRCHSLLVPVPGCAGRSISSVLEEFKWRRPQQPAPSTWMPQTREMVLLRHLPVSSFGSCTVHQTR